MLVIDARVAVGAFGRVGRGHVDRRVLVEEPERLEPEGDRVGRHDRPVLRAGDVVEAEHVPEHDVGALQRLVVGDPAGHPLVAFGLRRVRARRPALVVVVAGDPERVTDDRCSEVLGGGGVHHRREAGGRHELVGGVRAVPVRAGRVHDLPRPLRLPPVVASGLGLRANRGRVRDQVQPEGVVVGDGQSLGVDLHHGVLVTVDVQVQPGHDEVLVERRVRPVVHDGAGARGLGPLGVRRGHHDPGGAHLALDVAVLVEAPVDEVLVVGHRDVAGDDHAAHPADLGAGVAVDVLPEDRVVLLVETDRVRDVVGLARAVVQHRIDVDDLPETVAAELERRGHVAQAPLADVVGGATVVVERGVAVGNDHLREGQPVGDVADIAVVVIGDLVDDRALAVVEAQSHRPVLPAQLGALDREGDALGLGDVQRL